MTYRVEINDCLTQFHRAHQALIESLGGSRHYLARITMSGPQEHRQLMELNWRKLYNANPVKENSSWKYLDFDSEQHYIIFILKWS